MSIRNPSAPTAAPPIRSWSDGYAALRRRAGDTRGWIELDSDAPDRRWPRTTGLDVIVIASFVDVAFRCVDPAIHQGIARRWAACKQDLERDALLALDETYPENRAFWSGLAAVVAHLSRLECPLPSQATWSALLTGIGETPVRRVRNASPTQDRPPVWFAGADSLTELWLAQLKYLGKLRGSDRLAPEAGMTGGVLPIPRATNGEVTQLAEFWTKALDEPKAKHESGYDTVRARWNAVLRDVATYARGAGTDPNAVYPKNHAFWRAASSVAVHVTASLKYGLSERQRWMASVGEAIQVAIDRGEALASAVASSAADAAHGAGRIVNEGARGLLGGLMPPLLIGGGIVAAILLLRDRRESSS